MVQVSSPLTQLTLHPSPQHPSNVASLSQPLSVVKEEIQSSCSLARSTSGSVQPKDSPPGVSMDSSFMDKDQMLQEKDKQIEELTKMLRQKQQLVETLRSQLEQGKMTTEVVVKKEGSEPRRTSPMVELQSLIKASAVQPPMLPNGMVLTVKKEVEPEKEMEGLTKEHQGKKPSQPMQCSQETLLRLQQIHRLQLQAEQHKQQQQSQVQLQTSPEAKGSPPKQQEQKREAQILLQQQQLQQLIIQQTQQKRSQHKLLQLNQLKQCQQEVQAQQKNQLQLKQVHIQNQKPAVSQSQLRKQQRAHQRQQQKQAAAAAAACTQQVNHVNSMQHAVLSQDKHYKPKAV